MHDAKKKNIDEIMNLFVKQYNIEERVKILAFHVKHMTYIDQIYKSLYNQSQIYNNYSDLIEVPLI